MKTVTIGFNNESQKSLNDALALMKLRMKPTHAIDELVMAKFEEVVSSLGRIDFEAESKPEATIPKSPTPRTDAAKDFSSPEKMYKESRKIEMELNAKRRIITPKDLMVMNDVLLALHNYYALVVHLGGSNKLEKNIRGKMVNRDSIVNFANFVRDTELKQPTEITFKLYFVCDKDGTMVKKAHDTPESAKYWATLKAADWGTMLNEGYGLYSVEGVRKMEERAPQVEELKAGNK